MSDNNDIRTEAVESLSEQHGVPEDQLKEELEGFIAEEKEKGVEDPVRRGVRRLSLKHKGSSMGNYQEMRGAVLGFSDPINTSAKQIRNAKNYTQKKGPKAARKRGLIRPVPDGKDIPEWAATFEVTVEGQDREVAVIDSNSNSPTHGEIVPQEDYIRYAHGTVKRGEDYVFFSGVLDADDGVPPEPPLFEAAEFEASVSGNGDGENVQLRFRSADPFRQVDGPSGVDALEATVGTTELDDANTDNFDQDDLVVTKGSVSYMELAPGEDQSRRLTIVDPFDFSSDGGVTVWLPDHHDVNYADQSDVFVVGRVSPSNDPDYRDSINAVGVLPDPAFTVERDQVDPFDEGDDDSSEAEDDEALAAEAAEDDDPDDDERPADEAAAVAGGATTDGGKAEPADDEHGDFETDEQDEEWSW